MLLFDLYKKRKLRKIIQQMGSRGKSIYIEYPFHASNPSLVYIGDYSKILNDAHIIIYKGKFIVGKYTSISTHLTVVTDNHTPTVGIPYSFTGILHINDISKDIIIGDDCWIGSHVTLLPGAIIRRGAVVGACSLVNKEIPPYAVVAGIPAKIIGVKFSLEQILKHEATIYDERERYSRKDLESLFNKYYTGKKILGTDYISSRDKEKVAKYMLKLGFTKCY